MSHNFHLDGLFTIEIEHVSRLLVVDHIHRNHLKNIVRARQETEVARRLVSLNTSNSHLSWRNPNEATVAYFQLRRVRLKSPRRIAPIVRFSIPGKAQRTVPRIFRFRIGFSPWPLDEYTPSSDSRNARIERFGRDYEKVTYGVARGLRQPDALQPTSPSARNMKTASCQPGHRNIQRHRTSCHYCSKEDSRYRGICSATCRQTRRPRPGRDY